MRRRVTARLGWKFEVVIDRHPMLVEILVENLRFNKTPSGCEVDDIRKTHFQQMI